MVEQKLLDQSERATWGGSGGRGGGGVERRATSTTHCEVGWGISYKSGFSVCGTRFLSINFLLISGNAFDKTHSLYRMKIDHQATTE